MRLVLLLKICTGLAGFIGILSTIASLIGLELWASVTIKRTSFKRCTSIIKYCQVLFL